jgi:hypothetical protein
MSIRTNLQKLVGFAPPCARLLRTAVASRNLDRARLARLRDARLPRCPCAVLFGLPSAKKKKRKQMLSRDHVLPEVHQIFIMQRDPKRSLILWAHCRSAEAADSFSYNSWLPDEPYINGGQFICNCKTHDSKKKVKPYDWEGAVQQDTWKGHAREQQTGVVERPGDERAEHGRDRGRPLRRITRERRRTWVVHLIFFGFRSQLRQIVCLLHWVELLAGDSPRTSQCACESILFWLNFGGLM